MILHGRRCLSCPLDPSASPPGWKSIARGRRSAENSWRAILISLDQLPLSAGPLSLTSARSPLPAMRWSVRMAPFALATHNAGSTQAGVLDKTPPPSPPPTVCSSCSHHVVAQLGHLRQRSGDIATPTATSAGRVSTPSNSLMLLSHYRGGRGHAPSTLPICLPKGAGVCIHLVCSQPRPAPATDSETRPLAA